MPIVVAHEPDPRLIGQAAFAAGMGQHRQQQFQNGLQVMQLALQERARQQQMAAQQQAQQQAMQQQAMRDAADRQMQMRDMQMRQQMADRQLQQQLQMRQADNEADLARQRQADEQRQQNYSDLRTHQMTMQRERGMFDVVKDDADGRMKALNGIRAQGLNADGLKAAEQLRRDLTTITSRRRTGQSDDTEYAAAMQEWDNRFGQYGDWEGLRRDQKAELQQKFEASKFDHPEFGPGRMVSGRNGVEAFIPDKPVFQPGPNGQLLKGVFGADGTIDWEPVEQPKPAAPPKPQFGPKDVLALADKLYDDYINDPVEGGERDADILAGAEKTREDFFFRARQQLEMLSPQAPSAGPQQSQPQQPAAAPAQAVPPQAVGQMQAADADQARRNQIEAALPGNPEAAQIFETRIKPALDAGIPLSDPKIAAWVQRVEQRLSGRQPQRQPDPRTAKIIDMRKRLEPIMSPEQKADWDANIQPLLDQGVSPDDPRMSQAVQQLADKIRSRLKPGR